MLTDSRGKGPEDWAVPVDGDRQPFRGLDSEASEMRATVLRDGGRILVSGSADGASIAADPGADGLGIRSARQRSEVASVLTGGNYSVIR